MHPEATQSNIDEVVGVIRSHGLEAKIMIGEQQKIIGVIGDKTKMISVPLDAMPGVDHSVSISKSYKLASRDFHPMDSVIDVDGVKIGGGEPVIMEAVVKTVSGVPVPLFEAKMPYKALLKGMDNQLRINLDAEKRDQNRYEGLQVGSITAPNNNAGNWE